MPSLPHVMLESPFERCAFSSDDTSDEIKKLEKIEGLFDQVIVLHQQMANLIGGCYDDVISLLQQAVDKFEGEVDVFNHLPIIDELKETVRQKIMSLVVPFSSTDFLDRVDMIYEHIRPVHLNSYQHIILDDGDKQKLNEMIVTHLYRDYDFYIGDSLLIESGEPMDKMSDMRSQFMKLEGISDALNAGSIDRPLEWIFENRERLGQAGSELEFKLHVFKFIDLLKTYSGPTDHRALQYVGEHLGRYRDAHLNEYQKLMGCLALRITDSISPVPHRYACFFDNSYRLNLTREIERQFCILMGQCGRNPMRTVTSVGAKVLSGFCKAADIVAEDHGNRLYGNIEIPLYVRLEDEFKFHSRFVCPLTGAVMKTSLNPPTALSCGHVFSLQTILYYAYEGNHWTMTCPICSAVTAPPDYKTVYF